MNNILKSRNIKRRFIKESGGNFSLVHKILKEARENSETDSLDAEKIIRIIKKQRNNTKKAS